MLTITGHMTSLTRALSLCGLRFLLLYLWLWIDLACRRGQGIHLGTYFYNDTVVRRK